MKDFISDIAFSPAVKKFQEKEGSRTTCQRMAENRDWRKDIDPGLEEFILARDSFYMATANTEGQPYIQHRGGPKGFLKIIDKNTLGFADYSGNRQYISAGNLAENSRAQLFLMDYPNRTRVKIWGEAEVVDDDPDLLTKLMDEGYRARPERAIIFKVKAWDVNCPQHIQKRFTEEEMTPTITELKNRIAELEAALSIQNAE
ncbi:MAG: pyridoxamine 5'-phosphate oxidase family protein [Bacteroidota bacterium]